jgi:hypothetical protein
MGHYQARVDRFSIQENGAGPAFSFTATFLGTGQVQVISKEIKKTNVGRYFSFN